MILLDTHILIWLDSGDDRLGAQALKAIDEAHQAGELGISAISFWETAMRIEKGQLDLAIPVSAWRQDLLTAGLREIAMDGDIGITAATLKEFHGDPADRIITSTALRRGDRLLTADQKILDWNGPVQRQDARR